MSQTTNKKRVTKEDNSLPFTKENYLIFSAAMLFIILGYIFMAQGPWDSVASLTIAPILLIIGYLVLVPVAILFHKKEKQVQTENLGD